MSSNQVQIVAIVTTDVKSISGGGAPVFIVNNNEQLQKTAMDLEKIMDVSTHEINPATIILVAR